MGGEMYELIEELVNRAKDMHEVDEHDKEELQDALDDVEWAVWQINNALEEM